MRSSLAAVAASLVALPAAAPAAQAEGGWTWPVRGRVLTAYTNDNARPYAGGMHRGIDIAAGKGTPVVAARGGTVTYAGALGSSGIVVAVRSADGRHVASYLHLGAESVSRGEHVAAGTRIGAVGTTGRRSAPEPHLHFGVRLADVEHHYLDPLSLLPARGGRDAPAPVPVAAPVPARPQEQVVRALVPAGPAAVPRAVLVRHPVPRPAAVHPREAGSGHGRPLVLAGLGVLAVVLFGGAAARLNAAVNRRAAALGAAVRRLRPGRSAVLRAHDG